MVRAGLYLGTVQFFFVTCWTVYAVYLPQLAAQAGLPATWVPWLLAADQAVFAIADLAVGLAADRVVRRLGRLGRLMAVATVLSCGAFVALPFVAPAGSPVLLLGVTAVWAVTSAALRAPPMALLGRYVPKPSVPWMASLLLLGTGLAGAAAPWLTARLREADPRVPFVLASGALAVAVLAMAWLEQHLARESQPSAPRDPRLTGPVLLFFVASALLALGFQVHGPLNAARNYLRLATPAQLEALMPAFWLGFSLLMVPASALTRRLGGLPVMAGGALVGATASWLVGHTASLPVLVGLQAVSGGAWGVVLMSATSAAIAAGRSGREGLASGGLSALMALAALLRIAAVALQWPQQPGVQTWLSGLPPGLWLAAAIVLLLLARHAVRTG